MRTQGVSLSFIVVSVSLAGQGTLLNGCSFII